MVKKTFFILFLISRFYLSAGEFTASVSSTQVHLKENIILSLTLTDISPKEPPAVSILKKHFLIHSQQQSTNTKFINGQVSLNVTWKYSLTPKVDGAIEIPAITVDTEEGLLSTQPITLNVKKGSASTSNEDDIGVNIIAKVDKASPYKNEPIVYTAILTSQLPLYNVQTQKIQMEDAIVELMKEPKLEEKVIKGILLYVIEFTYLITPLKDGSLTIPSMALQGAIPHKKEGQFNSFIKDNLDILAIMQGFDGFQPFALMTNSIQLNVQPAMAEVTPWLPAKALTLEEVWPKDQILRSGEPFSRSFIIKSEGLKASQLPHLEQKDQNSTFRVYADKPEEQEKMLDGIIHSMRKEQYTLIPQQAGAWILPEISVDWWDSLKKEKVTTTIPARTVQILPAVEIAASDYHEDTFTAATADTAEASSPHRTLLLYGMIGMLTFFLMGAVLWGITLQRKISKLTQDLSQKPKKPTSPPKTATNKKNEKLPDLNPT